jgi:hypothetical protein
MRNPSLCGARGAKDDGFREELNPSYGPHSAACFIEKTMNQQRTVVMVGVRAQIASFNFPMP